MPKKLAMIPPNDPWNLRPGESTHYLFERDKYRWGFSKPAIKHRQSYHPNSIMKCYPLQGGGVLQAARRRLTISMSTTERRHIERLPPSARDARCRIKGLLSGGLPIREIAEDLNRSPGTVSREIAATAGTWLPSRAGMGEGPCLLRGFERSPQADRRAVAPHPGPAGADRGSAETSGRGAVGRGSKYTISEFTDDKAAAPVPGIAARYRS